MMGQASQVPEDDDEVMAMAEAAAEFSRIAEENNAGALVMYPYNGPPPPASFFLEMMREMIDSTGEALGSVCLSTGTESGTLPLSNMHPVDALHAILHGRMVGVIPKIAWITVAVDTYVLKDVKDPHVERGSAGAAFKRGDPNATEALMACCVAPDGPGYDVQQSYVRHPHGIEWEQPEDITGNQTGGDIPSLMHQIVLA